MSGAEIVVAAGGDQPSLAAAIAQAPAGARLRLRAGLYEGDLTVDKPLEIVGEGRRSRVIVKGRVRLAADATLAKLTLKPPRGGAGATLEIVAGAPTVRDCEIGGHEQPCLAIA